MSFFSSVSLGVSGHRSSPRTQPPQPGPGGRLGAWEGCAGKHPLSCSCLAVSSHGSTGWVPRDLCGGSSGRDTVSNPISHHFPLLFSQGNYLAVKGTAGLCLHPVGAGQATGPVVVLHCGRGTEQSQCPSGPKQGWGLGWVYTNQAWPSCCCHPIPWEQSCSHSPCEPWEMGG